MEIVESILTENPCYKAGRKITVKGLMLHSVGCQQPSAEVFVRNWNSAEAARACVHAFIDGNTGKVYQTLPWDHRAWHGGGDSNNTHIGVEMCEPGSIQYTGGASFTCTNREAAMEVVKRTYDAAVQLFAFLCKKFGLNPLGDGVIISHKEGHDRGIASGHGDPDHLWNGLQSGYTMDGFRRDVSLAMGEEVFVPEMSKSRSTQAAQSEVQVAAETVVLEGIRAGSIVAVAADGVYYTGKEMPDWVKADQWIVKSVDGDRAVIDRNVSGSHAICSPVNVKHLRLLSAEQAGVVSDTAAVYVSQKEARTGAAQASWKAEQTGAAQTNQEAEQKEAGQASQGAARTGVAQTNQETEQKEAGQASQGAARTGAAQTNQETEQKEAGQASQGAARTGAAQTSQKEEQTGAVAGNGEMTISDRGVELIARYEGCRLEAYKCPAGVWTIGYGHTAGVKPGDRLPSQEAAKILLREDLKTYGGYVNNCISKGLIIFSLNQNQFDALTSFCYNCGSGNLSKLVSGRNAATIADKMLEYNRGGGKVLEGLVRRRKEERALFLEAVEVNH